jgi:hypothetical protein
MLARTVMHGYARAAPPARPHTPLHNMCRTVVDVAKRAVRQQYDVRTQCSTFTGMIPVWTKNLKRMEWYWYLVWKVVWEPT